MNGISRRDFIKVLSITLGTAVAEQFLTACGHRNASSVTAEPMLPSTQTTAAPSPDADTDALESAPDLVVARNGEPEELVRRALTQLGGISRFVPKGAYVIIKPNICTAYHTYEYAATTNPWIIGELVRQCLAAEARKVQVMDSPFGGSAEAAYVKSGIEEQVNKAGGEMMVMPFMKFVPTEIPNGKDLHKLNIYDDILKRML